MTTMNISVPDEMKAFVEAQTLVEALLPSKFACTRIERSERPDSL